MMMSNAVLTTVQAVINDAKDTFNAVLSDQSINYEREAAFAMQALSSNDYLRDTAATNRQSLFNAVENIAAIGISLNPSKKQAYLVPRGGKICLDISYMGLMDLAISTGSILWAQSSVVYENDKFQLNGLDSSPVHSRDPFSKDRGEIVGVYAVVKTKDGDYLTHTMAIDDVYKIRSRSSSFKPGKSSPWTTDAVEMIKKTCVKQAYKYWPRSDRLDSAIDYLNNQDPINTIECVSESMDTAELEKQITECKTIEELKNVWICGASKFSGNLIAFGAIQSAKDKKKIELSQQNVEVQDVEVKDEV